jgi:NAD(P)-dependent dehydrogenase (short-subunit alcohol dehydrogenase family)
MITPSMRLDGKVAVVTGGGGGLGTLACCAFAEAGADVVVAARHLDKCEATADKVRALGRKALATSTDVTRREQVDAMVDAAVKAFGRIDILFNNAGITSSRTMLDSPEDEWLRIIDVNVKGTFLCTKAVAPVMKAQGEGRIINMGSVLSKAGMANRSAYAVSKAGIASFTKSMAFELGPFGITVNALGPTVIVTDLNRELVKTQPELYGALLHRTPLGRLGQPEDIAGALVFLASPAAAFITGHTLYVDGGYTAG